MYLWLLVTVATTSPAGEFEVRDPAAAGFKADKLARIRPAMQRHIEEGKLVGGLGLVARGDRIVYAETWGQRDREKKLPMTDDTIFRIYSMSKPVTSVAAMILVENGKLGLEAPISKYLPELAKMTVLVETKGDDGKTRQEEAPVERAITVRDLLRHTSGFTYGFFGNSEVDKRYRKAGLLVTDRTLEDTVKKLSQIPLKHQPGTQWHYSVSTDVLGRVNRRQSLCRGITALHLPNPYCGAAGPELNLPSKSDAGMRLPRPRAAIIVGAGISLEATPMSDVIQVLSVIEQGDPSAVEQLLAAAGGRLFIFTTECCTSCFQGERK